MRQQRSPKIDFREIFRVVRFSTFATKSAKSGNQVLAARDRNAAWAGPNLGALATSPLDHPLGVTKFAARRSF
jgi:hypothetical protein